MSSTALRISATSNVGRTSGPGFPEEFGFQDSSLLSNTDWRLKELAAAISTHLSPIIHDLLRVKPCSLNILRINPSLGFLQEQLVKFK